MSHTLSPAAAGRAKRRVPRWALIASTAGMVTMGMVTSATMVWQSSQAAFSASTSNVNNTWAVGSVSIEDNDANSVMFNLTGLVPGATGSQCIAVRYTGSMAPAGNAIKFYFSNVTEQDGANGAGYGSTAAYTAGQLDDYLSMRIQVNNADLGTTAPALNSCAGATFATDLAGVAPGTVMSTLISARTNYGNGLSFSPANTNQWRVWQFTYTLSASAPDAVQNDGLRVTFNWETQST